MSRSVSARPAATPRTTASRPGSLKRVTPARADAARADAAPRPQRAPDYVRTPYGWRRKRHPLAAAHWLKAGGAGVAGRLLRWLF